MALFEDASRAFAGKVKNDPKPTESEVEQLRAELAALQAKVDKLGD
jgi:polyhydroxyalkanoate synthesis regulator protein